MKTKQKVVLGQFFTKETLWLKPHIIDFIKNSKCTTAYDPFAGGGDLLDSARELGFTKLVGLDIDGNLGWKVNDSLLNIPHIDEKTIIVTNPPYLTNYSAARKEILEPIKKYYENNPYCDLYLIALDKMLNAQKYVVAIIPETFINSNFKKKNLLHSITILEENPFYDTDTPIVVACFDGKEKDLSKVLIYKNETLINNLASLDSMRLVPTKSLPMKFNDPYGWLAVRCVDSTNPLEKLRFDFKENIKYDWKNGIKHSSRLLTLIDLELPDFCKQEFINKCNEILAKFRNKTGDVILSPFKGNMHNQTRRRRLDFKTCRAIVEQAYIELYGKKEENKWTI